MAPSAAQPLPRQAAPQAEPARPLLTIALPTCDRGGHLDRFLTHHIEAFSTGGIDVEILVCDDCSTDETPEVVARRAAHDARIRAVRQPENIGAYGNFLHACNQARGTFVLCVGDGDRLIPEAVEAHLARLAASPDIVMLRAPALPVEGAFRRSDRDELFDRGEHARCLDVLLTRQAVAERFIIRTDAAADILEADSTFVLHDIAHLAHALNAGKVLFAAEPFAREAIAASDRGEAMRGWDRFRGGLEYLASFVTPDDPAAMPLGTFLTRLHDVTLRRMAAAASLHADAGNWSTAYHLDRRLRAYGRDGIDPEMRPLVSGLAAIETVIAEAQTQARGLVVLDDIIPDDTLHRLAPKLRAAILRQGDQRAASATPKAFALLQGPPSGLVGPDDILVDLAAAFRRCPP